MNNTPRPIRTLSTSPSVVKFANYRVPLTPEDTMVSLIDRSSSRPPVGGSESFLTRLKLELVGACHSGARVHADLTAPSDPTPATPVVRVDEVDKRGRRLDGRTPPARSLLAAPALSDGCSRRN